MWAHIRGWHIGVNVRLFVNEDGNDEISLHITGGSKNPNQMRLIFRDEHGKEMEFEVGKEYHFVVPKDEPIILNTEN